MPIPGDRRSVDGVALTADFDAIVEAETRLDDVQAAERRLRGKQRDLDTKRAILLVSDTRHNRTSSTRSRSSDADSRSTPATVWPRSVAASIRAATAW
jgi:hypothetical protein